MIITALVNKLAPGSLSTLEIFQYVFQGGGSFNFSS